MKGKEDLIADYRVKIKEFFETEVLLRPSPIGGGYMIGMIGGGYVSTQENYTKVQSVDAEIKQLENVLELGDEEQEDIWDEILKQDWYIKIENFKMAENKKMMKTLPKIMEWTNKIMGDKTFPDEHIEHAKNVKEAVDGIEKIIEDENKKFNEEKKNEFIKKRDGV